MLPLLNKGFKEILLSFFLVAVAFTSFGIPDTIRAHDVDVKVTPGIPGAAAKLVFITPPRTMSAGTPSGIITVQTQDVFGDIVNVTSNISVNLTSTSNQGKFSLAASPWLDITSVIIPNGSNSASFYYKDGTSDQPLITASESPDKGWVDAVQQQTVTSVPGGKEGGTPAVKLSVILNGVLTKYLIDVRGELLEDILIYSENGKFTLSIPSGTFIKDAEGYLVINMNIDAEENFPPPPEGSKIIGVAYNFEPSGVIFTPPITMQYTYEPFEILGVEEVQLFIAYYDTAIGEWIELPSTVDPENNTITAPVSHLTMFAVIGLVEGAAFTPSSIEISPSVVTPEEVVTVSALITNTGGMKDSHTVVLKINGVKELEKSITIDAGGSETVTFSVTRGEPGNYTVDVDGRKADFTVVAPAAFSTENLAIQPTQVEPNEAVTVSASITNTGGMKDSHTVVLKINGVKELEKSITIDAGSSETVTFSVTRGEPGSYTVDVDGLSADFTVVAPTTPILEGINWSIVGASIAALVMAVMGLSYLFLYKRLKRRVTK